MNDWVYDTSCECWQCQKCAWFAAPGPVGKAPGGCEECGQDGPEADDAREARE